MRNGRQVTALAALGLLAAAAPATAQSWAGAEASTVRRAAFGASLAVGQDAVLVGEPRNTLRPGIVYVYGRSDSGWTEQAQLRAPDAANADGFGAALALEGTTLLVAQAGPDAAGRVHTFTRTGSAWQHAGTFASGDVAPTDAFGASLGLSGDWAVVGAPGTGERAGAVYVYQRQGTTWAQQTKLAPADLQAGDLFGASMALSGNRLVVGAPGRNARAGTVYAFEMNAGTWSEAGQFAARGIQENELFGASLAIAGDMVLAGAPAAASFGATFAFRRNQQGEWAQGARLVAFDGGGRDAFGSAIAAAGDEIWIGSPNASGTGAVYVFERAATEGIAGVERILSAEAARRDAFGSTVAVRENLAAVGLTRADGGAGSVAIYERDATGAWNERALVESEAEALPSVTGGEVRCGDDNKATIFDCSNVELVAFLPIKDIGGGRGTNLNDIWGWTDAQTGREYALVGRTDGTSFVDITDAENPVYLGDLPMTEGSPSSSWRDIKVYQDHAYIVADNAGAHGMQVFDLTRLRDVTSPQTFTADARYDRINSAHNVVINEESGFAYAVGSSSGGETCGGGLHMIDVRDPKNPTFAGCFADPQTGRASTGYSHDAQCVMYRGPDSRYTGREICMGANETALSIADVTDKSAPKALSRASYPNVAYAHQGWLSDDHRYFYANDEGDESNGSVQRTRTLVWDVSNLEDPQLVKEYLGETSAIDHNLYVQGNFVYESNYMAGLRILDISNPEEPVEVGYLDTLPFGENSPSFAGSWSNYPFFESGNIVVTSIGEGLFVVKKRSPTTVF